MKSKVQVTEGGGGLAKSLLRVTLNAILVLLVPLLAMQFSDQVDWTATDFVAAGALLVTVGLAFELFVRKVAYKRDRLVLTVLLVVMLAYLWLELSVGVFTHWGS